VQRFTPLLAEAARPCQHAVGHRWWVDETYVKVAGRWRYVYRAIDQFGQVIDVYVSPRRDATAARRFFEKAIRETKTMPVEVVTDLAPVPFTPSSAQLPLPRRDLRIERHLLDRGDRFGLQAFITRDLSKINVEYLFVDAIFEARAGTA
jgi:transposase, IS6 family